MHVHRHGLFPRPVRAWHRRVPGPTRSSGWRVLLLLGLSVAAAVGLLLAGLAMVA